MQRDAIEALYRQHLGQPSATALHLPRLRTLATGCEQVAELGVKRGASTTALLLGAKHVTSVDLTITSDALKLQQLAGKHWTLLKADTRTVTLPAVDLLFVDASHTFASVEAELIAHADKVRGRLVFHDTITFGSVGADGETGRQLWLYGLGQSVPLQYLGIRPAIDNLMIRDPSWQIESHDPRSHGLLVLRRAS